MANVSSVQLTWPGNGTKQLESKLIQIDTDTRRFVAGQFLYHEPIATGYMKENAPWTDRTGNARAGLHTTHNFEPGIFELILAHSVYYGIYLEVCNSGKYSIIDKAVVHIGDMLMQRMEHMFSKLGGEIK